MNDLGVKIKDYSEMRVLLCTIIRCNFDKLLKADDVTDCVFNVAWSVLVYHTREQLHVYNCKMLQ